MTAPRSLVTKPKPYNCKQMGHIWLEANGAIYVRHNARDKAMIALHCKYCAKTTELQAKARHTAPITGDSITQAQESMNGDKSSR